MGFLRILPASCVVGAVLRCAIVACCVLLCIRLQAQASQANPIQEPAIRIVDSIDENRLMTLRGNTHPFAQARFDRGAVSPDLPMGDLILVLRRAPERQAIFDAFVASQYDRASPNYHHWLAPDEVGERFGPAISDIEAISNWLRNHGFSVDEVSKDRLSIRFSGLSGQVESAFHTQIHSLAVKTKQQTIEPHIGNMSDPQIPEALSTVVVGVKALHDFFPRPLHRLGAQVTRDVESGGWRRIPEAQTQAATLSLTSPEAAGMVRPRPQFGTLDGYGNSVEDVAPYDFATIYNVLPLWNASTPVDGTGQTIAIAGTSNINPADVAAFRSAFGLPVKAPTVVITNNDPGACSNFASPCAGDLVENTLDVEWAGAVAKGASVVLVTSSAPTATTDALYLSESYIVQNRTATIMNVSYGNCELALGNAGNTQYNNLWQTAAAEGIAVFVASGDAGSPACDQGYDAIDGVPYPAVFGLAVSGLTSTPYNTSVGGTDFNWGATPAPYWNATNSAVTKASALGYIPEVPWNSSCVNALILPALQSDANYLGVSGVDDAESACNFIENYGQSILTNYGVDLSGLVDTIGGGGGASNCTTSNAGYPGTCGGGYAKPSWQAKVTGIPGDGKRDVPDVSFFASNGFLGSAYLICVSAGGSSCTYSSTTEPVALEVGGTSVASPAMAGVMALINQRAGASQGNPNTNLYLLASEQQYSSCSAETVKSSSTACVFNDIDTGNNAMACLNPAINASFNCNVASPQDVFGILTGYNAGKGYDQATGLGSLNVANVVNNWPTSSTGPQVALTPAALSFATTTLNSASSAQVITLKNTGKSALTLSGSGLGISIAGTNATSFSQSNTCGTSVAAAASCTISVVFKPLTAGSLTASVNIADNAYGSPQSVALSGTGAAAAPSVSISANSLSFGSTAVGATNTAPAITLTNTGTGPLTVSSIGFTGANASSFTQTNTCGSIVAAGANCAITITFKPLTAGRLTAALSVADNANGSPQTVAVSGTATGGSNVKFSSAGLTFASTAVGATSAAQTLSVTNIGKAAITFSSFAFSGTNASSFLIPANNCITTLASGATCNLTVAFKPTTTGTLTANLLATDTDTGSPQSLPVSGTGTQAAAPAVSFSPASLAFPSTAVGSTSATQVVTLKNTGTAALTVSSYSFAGANASSFVFSANACTSSLAAGASCALSIAFKPTAAGSAAASLAVADNATGSPQTVALSGTATSGASIKFSATSLTFGSTAVGSTSATQSLYITNLTKAAITFSSIAFSGTNASSFVISGNTCTGSLASGATCGLTIAFKPTVTGALTASLSVTDSADASPQTVAVIGTATGGASVKFSAATLTFASTAVGATSTAQALYLTNTGSSSLSFTSFTFSGANASSFLISSQTCTTTLASGATCSLSIAFKPAITGALSASLTVADNASGSPQTAALSGTGAAGAGVKFSAASLTFPSTSVGATSAAQALYITNTGKSTLTLTSLSFTGANANSFLISAQTCTTSLASGATCSLSISFKPTATGALSANFAATDNASGSPQTVALTGTGK